MYLNSFNNIEGEDESQSGYEESNKKSSEIYAVSSTTNKKRSTSSKPITVSKSSSKSLLKSKIARENSMNDDAVEEISNVKTKRKE